MKFYRKRYRRKGKGKVAKKVKNYVKKVLDHQVEDKYYQGYVGFPTVSNSDAAVGTSIYFTNMVQGTGNNQRVGNRIRVKSIKINFTFDIESDPDVFNPLNPNAIAQYRWALTQYTAQTGNILCATPADAAFNAAHQNSIWTNSAAGVIIANQRNVLGYPNMKVLRNGLGHIHVTGGGVNNVSAVHRTINIRFKKPILVTFSANATGASACQRNGLWLNMMAVHVADPATFVNSQVGFTLTYEDA